MKNRKLFRSREEHVEDTFVDFSVVNKVLSEPKPLLIADYHWLHGLTSDEKMVIHYKLDSKVYEGTIQCAALDRHRNRLPLWRRWIHPIPTDKVEALEVSPAALAVLNKLGVNIL
jgi:hypothetical protein